MKEDSKQEIFELLGRFVLRNFLVSYKGCLIKAIAQNFLAYFHRCYIDYLNVCYRFLGWASFDFNSMAEYLKLLAKLNSPLNLMYLYYV